MTPESLQRAIWMARDLVKKFQVPCLSPIKTRDGNITIGYGRKAVWNEVPYSIEYCENALLNDLEMRAAKMPGGLQIRELAGMIATEHLGNVNCRELGRHGTVNYLQSSTEPWAETVLFVFLEGKITP